GAGGEGHGGPSSGEARVGAADGAGAGRDAAAPAPSASVPSALDAQARIESWAVCIAVRTSSRLTVPPVAMVANIPFIAWPTVVSNWSSQGTSGSGSERSA